MLAPARNGAHMVETSEPRDKVISKQEQVASVPAIKLVVVYSVDVDLYQRALS